MKKCFAFLMLFVSIPIAVVCLFFIEGMAVEYKEEEIYEFWVEKEKSYAEYTDISKVINWAGVLFTKEETTFKKEEKTRLVDYVQNRPSGFGFKPNSVVYKEDLDGDGKVEYIATLVIRPAQPFHYGEVIAVLIPEQKGFKIRVVSPPLHIGGGYIISLQFVDIDGDGLKEIVEQREDEGLGSYDVFDSVIYKNDNMFIHEIYRRSNYDRLSFADLNGDGQMEVLETRNETPIKTNDPKRKAMEYFDPKWQWINIYNWDGMKLQLVNEKHLPFYIERQKIYRSLLETSKKEIESRKERKLITIEDEEASETMKFYIDRIEKMKRSMEQKSK